MSSPHQTGRSYVLQLTSLRVLQHAHVLYLMNTQNLNPKLVPIWFLLSKFIPDGFKLLTWKAEPHCSDADPLTRVCYEVRCQSQTGDRVLEEFTHEVPETTRQEHIISLLESIALRQQSSLLI